MTIHDDLREVMGLLGKATPGNWRASHAGRGSRGQSFKVTEAYVYSPSVVDDVALASDVIDPITQEPSEGNAKAIAAAVNFLRQHGPALLARQEGEWSPIESAPKDRPVIITNGDAVGEASYHESDGGWWWAGYHPTDAADGYVWQPSHWHPLPALPAARSGGGG